MSDSYEISSPVQFSNNVVGSNLGQIQIDGSLLCKNHFIWARNGQRVSVNSNTTSTQYTLYYPNTAPNLYQALLTTANANVFAWYDLEAPGTLVVRSNPAPGQFSNLESAVQSISNFATPHTIWVQPGNVIASNANSILTIPPSVTIRGFGQSSRLIDYQLSFVSSNANDFVSGIQDVVLQRINSINTNFAISTIESNGNHLFNRITFTDYENWFNFINQSNDSSATIKVTSVISDPFPTTFPRVIANLAYSSNSGPNVTIVDLIANTDASSTTSPFLISGPSNTSNKTRLMIKDSSLQTNTGLVSSANYVVNVTSVDQLKLSSDYFFNYNNVVNANGCSTNSISLENITSQRSNTMLLLTNANVTSTTNFEGITNLNSYNTDTEQNLASFSLLDRAKNRGIKEISFFDDFTSNAIPFSDTVWSSLGTISQIKNNMTFPQYTNGLLSLTMDNLIIQNYVLYKSSAPFLNGTFLKFMCSGGAFGTTIPSPAGTFSAVIGLGDKTNVITNTNANATFDNGIWFSWTRSPAINEVRFHWATNGSASSNLVATLVQDWSVLEFDYVKDPQPTSYVYVHSLSVQSKTLIFSTNSNLLPSPNTFLQPMIKFYSEPGSLGNFNVDYVGYYSRTNLKRTN